MPKVSVGALVKRDVNGCTVSVPDTDAVPPKAVVKGQLIVDNQMRLMNASKSFSQGRR